MSNFIPIFFPFVSEYILHALDWTIRAVELRLEHFIIRHCDPSSGKYRRLGFWNLALFKGNSPTGMVLTSGIAEHVSIWHPWQQSLRSLGLHYPMATPFSSGRNQSSSSQLGQALAAAGTQSMVVTPEIPAAGSGGWCGLAGSSQMCKAVVAMPRGSPALPGRRRTCEPTRWPNWNWWLCSTASTVSWSWLRPGSWEASRSGSSGERSVLAVKAA